MEQRTMIQIDQTLLQHLPFGLVLIDTDGKIAWANEKVGQMLDSETDGLIGRSLTELPKSARDLLTKEPKLFAVGSDHWVKRETHHDEQGQQLLVLTDVSDQERLAEENSRLRQQVDDLKLTDDLTGLPNKRAISQALDLHISRSRRYQNPLSTVLVHVDMHQPDGTQPLSTEPLILAVSRFLRDRLRWVDQIARWEDNLFLLVLPETTEADARGLVDKIRTEQHSMLLPETAADTRPRLAFGMTCWKKGDDMRTLLRAALRDLQDHLTG